MAHTDIHQEAHSPGESLPRLLYGLNDKPPFKDSLFVGLQHVCEIFMASIFLGIADFSNLGNLPLVNFPIATGSICALVLNLVVPRPKEESLAALEEPIAGESTVPMEPK